MVITCIELERTSIIKGIEIFKMGKFRRDGDGSFLFYLAIDEFHVVTILLKRGSKISETDRLCPDGGLIEILNGRLNE
jgi:hypothetical protein